jgi:hypothetical protein
MVEINLTQLETQDLRLDRGSPRSEQAAAPEAVKAEEVLVVGVSDWAVAEAAVQLAAAGRKVHRCSDSTDAPFPCNALVPGRGCPLDRNHIDVVLDVHSGPRSKLQLSEMGVICGLRDRLPLVVGGISDASTLGPWAEQVPPGGDIVSTCDAALRKRAAQPTTGTN